MTGKYAGWRRGVCTAAAGIAVTAGLALGTVGITHADPAPSPAPAPAPSASPAAQGPVTAPSAVTTTTPKPTVAVEGGASAAAATTATAAAAAGDALDQLAEEYATGAGGGQLSNLLKVSLKLRAMGYKPSKQYLDELTTAMKYRPNQLPLIDALKDTIAYQQKIKAQMDVLSNSKAQQGAAMGAGAAPGPGSPVSVVATPPPAAAPPMPPTP
ncbi:MAG: hypothetical protein KIH64_010635 [Mycobacterium sp.]|nr:hypothetical protein [Mycobacterium sp.]